MTLGEDFETWDKMSSRKVKNVLYAKDLLEGDLHGISPSRIKLISMQDYYDMRKNYNVNFYRKNKEIQEYLEEERRREDKESKEKESQSEHKRKEIEHDKENEPQKKAPRKTDDSNDLRNKLGKREKTDLVIQLNNDCSSDGQDRVVTVVKDVTDDDLRNVLKNKKIDTTNSAENSPTAVKDMDNEETVVKKLVGGETILTKIPIEKQFWAPVRYLFKNTKNKIEMKQKVDLFPSGKDKQCLSVFVHILEKHLKTFVNKLETDFNTVSEKFLSQCKRKLVVPENLELQDCDNLIVVQFSGFKRMEKYSKIDNLLNALLETDQAVFPGPCVEDDNKNEVVLKILTPQQQTAALKKYQEAKAKWSNSFLSKDMEFLIFHSIKGTVTEGNIKIFLADNNIKYYALCFHNLNDVAALICKKRTEDIDLSVFKDFLQEHDAQLSTFPENNKQYAQMFVDVANSDKI